MKLFYAGLLLGAVAISACDDTTATMGLTDTKDEINTSSRVYTLYSKSLKADSILSSSSYCYLGQVVDPETQSVIKADFLAQFNTIENYEFPKAEYMITENGEIVADSIEVRLYFQSFYGDADNPMKLEVYELDPNNVIREDTLYYSNLDLSKFVLPGSKPLATKVFSATDYTVDSNTQAESNYYKNVRIVLPKSLGNKFLRKYYENKNYYANSYNFIRNVCPGFYFKLTAGSGTMLYLDVSCINLFFRYKEKDKVVDGMARFSATPEVIQSNRIENDKLDELVQKTECTYLKTPAGIYTELTLPVDEIYAGHENDSVSNAQITLQRYNASEQSDYRLGTPKYLLMLRKKELISFFEEKKVADGVTSYTTAFDANFNNYTFKNFNRLLAACYNEKRTEAKKAGITPDEWANRHPDWNKVVLVPVTINTNMSGYMVSVTHDVSLSSIRLVGGSTPLKMQVIYSKFN